MQTKRDFTKDYSCNQNRRIAKINKAVTWQTKGHMPECLLFRHGSTAQRKHKTLFSTSGWKKRCSLYVQTHWRGETRRVKWLWWGEGLLWGGGLVMLTLWLTFSQHASHGRECSEAERTAEKAQHEQKNIFLSHRHQNNPPSSAWKINVLFVYAQWRGLLLKKKKKKTRKISHFYIL